MKKFISILLSLLLILNTLTTVFAVGTAITLQVDSNTINIGSHSVTIDTAPVIIDGRTMLPVRGVSEAMGGNVDWNNDTKTVTITLGSNKVEMTVMSFISFAILSVVPIFEKYTTRDLLSDSVFSTVVVSVLSSTVVISVVASCLGVIEIVFVSLSQFTSKPKLSAINLAGNIVLPFNITGATSRVCALLLK